MTLPRPSVRRTRQMMLGKVADEYRKLVDVRLNRVRAGVTMAHEVDALSRSVIVERLAKAIGKDIIAGFRSIRPSSAESSSRSATGYTMVR